MPAFNPESNMKRPEERRQEFVGERRNCFWWDVGVSPWLSESYSLHTTWVGENRSLLDWFVRGQNHGIEDQLEIYWWGGFKAKNHQKGEPHNLEYINSAEFFGRCLNKIDMEENTRGGKLKTRSQESLAVMWASLHTMEELDCSISSQELVSY